MRDRPTPSDLIDKLDALGSPRQIADYFEQEGVAGHRHTTNSCPLANYLNRETGRLVHIDGLGWHDHNARRMDQLGDLPRNVRGFVAAFDSGIYSALIERGVR